MTTPQRYRLRDEVAWTDQRIDLNGKSTPLLHDGDPCVVVVALPDGAPTVISGTGTTVWEQLAVAAPHGLTAEQLAAPWTEDDGVPDQQLLGEMCSVLDDWVDRGFLSKLQ